MKNLTFVISFFLLFACNQQSTTAEQIETPKKLNQNNEQVTVMVDVSYSLSAEEIKTFITDEHAPFFFELEDSGIVRFEWFMNEEQSTATLIEVFENANAFQELGGKVLGSPINIRFNELFKREGVTVLGEVSDEFKGKLQPMNPAFKTYIGGIN
ncbi:MAG: hypothetical protein CMC18_03985 [Flavobacteriaceae bacterium]|nr:hypothetical protein [Flavobacteriaceae bacterium]